MPLYQYQALDQLGKKQSGVIEAQLEKEAKERLRERGLMVVSLAQKAGVSSRQNLKGENLQAFTMQLAQLVNAGVPLYESLVAIEEQYRHESFHRILLSLCDQIKRGSSLSEAMKQYPDSFDKLYSSMVAAGEAAGALGLILERLSQLLSKQLKMRKELSAAMIYPGVLACFSLLVIGMLLGFVVPSIEGMFAERQLNGFTSFVLGLSRFFREKWWLYLPASLGIFSWAFFQLRSQKGKLWLQRFVLKIPVVKRLAIQTAVARFSRTLSTLQQGGLPLIDALRMSTEVMKNIALEEEMKTAELKIIEGSSLSTQLSRSKFIPSMVSRMVRVGEDSGNLPIMLEKIADMYEENLEKTLATVTALAQPIILIIMGGIIGMVMIAILLPLTDVASFSLN